MTQATLPRQWEDHDTIEELPLNRTFYTVPWAMSVSEDRKCWLNPRYSFRLQPGGTVQMPVERHNDGYHVWLTPEVGWYKWRPDDNPTGLVPVTRIHRER